MFHRAVIHHGHSTEEMEEGFRTRAVYSVLVQERLEPWGGKEKKVTSP